MESVGIYVQGYKIFNTKNITLKTTADMQSTADTLKSSERPETLNIFPNDAKLIQYTYLQQKARLYLKHVTHIEEIAKSDSSTVFDTQMILNLAGIVFNLNDNFYRRSEILQTCQKYNGLQKIEVTPLNSPINFDSLENISRNCPVGPFGIMRGKSVSLPEKKKINDCIVLLELLLVNVLEVIDSKVQSLQSQCKIRVPDINKFIELDNIEKLRFHNIPDLNVRDQETILRYYLKSQMENLEIINATYSDILESIKPRVINVYQMYNQLLRIADIYAELRKIGKMVYFQNLKFFEPYQRNRRHLAAVLKDLNSLFTQNKQNGMLLTLISKYARRTIIKDIKLDYGLFVNDFKKRAQEMYSLIEKMVSVLGMIAAEWKLIVDEGREKEFDQGYLREKIKQEAIRREEARNKAQIDILRRESLRKDSVKAQMEIKRRESLRRQSIIKMGTPVRVESGNNPGSRSNSLTLNSRNSYISGSRSNSLTNSNINHFLSRTDEMRNIKKDLDGIQERDESPGKQIEQEMSELRITSEAPLVKSRLIISNGNITEGKKILSVNGTIKSHETNSTTSATHTAAAAAAGSLSNTLRASNQTGPTLSRRNSVVGTPMSNNNPSNGFDIKRRNSVIGSIPKTGTATNENAIRRRNSYLGPSVSHSNSVHALEATLKSGNSVLVSPSKPSSLSTSSNPSPVSTRSNSVSLSSPSKLLPILSPSKSSSARNLSKESPSRSQQMDPPKPVLVQTISHGSPLTSPVKVQHLTASQRYQQNMARAAKTGSIYGKPITSKRQIVHQTLSLNEDTALISQSRSTSASTSEFPSSMVSASTSFSPSPAASPVASSLEIIDTCTIPTEVDDFPERKVRFTGVAAWTPLEDAPSAGGVVGAPLWSRRGRYHVNQSSLSIYKEGALWKESLREEKSQNSGPTSAAKRLTRMFRR